MKYIALFILFSSAFLFVTGQNGSSRIGSYKWDKEVVMTRCFLDGTPDQRDGKVVIERSWSGLKFNVIDLKNGEAILRVIDITETDSRMAKEKKLSGTGKLYKPAPSFYRLNFIGNKSAYEGLTDEEANARSYGDRQAYFKVGVETLDDFASSEDKIAGGLAFGVINFPFRYRFQKESQDFAGSFNFGAGVGYRLPHKKSAKFTYSFLSGYSISNINMDIESVKNNKEKLTTTNNFTAFSFCLGLMVEYERVQVGTFMGWDRINRLNQKEFGWIHQGKPWLSLGFGYSIFSAENQKASRNDQQESR